MNAINPIICTFNVHRTYTSSENVKNTGKKEIMQIDINTA